MGAIRVSAREGYALWADTWDATPSPIVALEHRALLPWIARLHPRRAIDVGCGTGRWTARLSAIGVDASPAMLAVAAAKPGLRGRLAVADATALPIASAAADLVLCALTLGHIQRSGRRHAGIRPHPGAGRHAPAHRLSPRRRRARLAAHLPPRRTRLRTGESCLHGGSAARRAHRTWSLSSARRRRSENPSARSFDAAGKPELFAAACAHAGGPADPLGTDA